VVVANEADVAAEAVPASASEATAAPTSANASVRVRRRVIARRIIRLGAP
jgi:hypothetical protein